MPLQWGWVPSNPDGRVRLAHRIGASLASMGLDSFEPGWRVPQRAVLVAHRLQWSRVPSNPDGVRARREGTRLAGPSMGPGSFEPGWQPRRQRAAGGGVASMGPGSFEPGWRELPRGGHRRPGPASMGPGSFEPGWRRPRRLPGCGPSTGFNGAGFLRTRMDSWCKDCSNRRSRLQWGRVPSNPDGTAVNVISSHLKHASMGPGSFEPGWH